MVDKHEHIVSVIGIVLCNNKILLVQRNPNDNIFPGKWQNPGGKVEAGEKVEEALQREIKEEIGLDFKKVPIFLHSYSWEKDENEPMRLGLIFLIELEGKPEDYNIQLNNELVSYGWFDYDEAKELDTIGIGHPTGTIGQISFALKGGSQLEAGSS